MNLWIQSHHRRYSTSLRLKDTRQVDSNVKVMLLFSLAHTPQDQIIIKDLETWCSIIIVMLCGTKETNVLAVGTWQLYHNTVPSHPSHQIQYFFGSNPALLCFIKFHTLLIYFMILLLLFFKLKNLLKGI